MKKETALI